MANALLLHGRTYHIRKNAIAYTLKPKCGIILSQYWRFLDDTWKGNSDFGRGYDGSIYSKTPFKDLAPINGVKKVLIHIRFNNVYHYQEYA